MIGAQPAQQNPPTAGWYVFPDRQGEPSYWDGCRWRVEEPVSQTELARTRAHRALAVMAVWALSLVAGFLGAGTGSGTIAGALVAVLFLAPWVALGFAIAAGSAAAAATPPGVRGGPVQRLIGWAFASAVLGLCGTGALVLLALAASADYL